jgi:hypothetical protein
MDLEEDIMIKKANERILIMIIIFGLAMLSCRLSRSDEVFIDADAVPIIMCLMTGGTYQVDREDPDMSRCRRENSVDDIPINNENLSVQSDESSSPADTYLIAFESDAPLGESSA